MLQKVGTCCYHCAWRVTYLSSSHVILFPSLLSYKFPPRSAKWLKSSCSFSIVLAVQRLMIIAAPSNRRTEHWNLCTVHKQVNKWLLLKIRRLVAILWPRSPNFDPGSVYLIFVVDRVALGQVCQRILRFCHQYHSTNAPYSFICHRCYIISGSDMPNFSIPQARCSTFSLWFSVEATPLYFQ